MSKERKHRPTGPDQRMLRVGEIVRHALAEIFARGEIILLTGILREIVQLHAVVLELLDELREYEAALMAGEPGGGLGRIRERVERQALDPEEVQQALHSPRLH